MKKIDSEVELAAIADPTPEMARFRMSETGVDDSNAKIYPSAASLLENADRFDALMVGSNCDSHSSIAVECAANQLPLFLEKPVAINSSQLDELAERLCRTRIECRRFVSAPRDASVPAGRCKLRDLVGWE